MPAHHGTNSHKAGLGSSTARERHRLFMGLALLLTVLAEVSPRSGFGAVNTNITSNNDPSALQQLATFAALAEVAEEEDLDWGALTRLSGDGGKGPRRRTRVADPNGDNDSNGSKDATSATAHSASSSRMDSASDCEEVTGHSSGSVSTSSATSRRRPHRRQHRKKGSDGASSTGSSQRSHTEGGYGASSVTSMDSSPARGSVHNYPIWSQLHVMEVAYSTRSNNFIHVTQRFAEYERMFPTVYQCAISRVSCPAEAELLASPSTGIAASRHWSCERCGRRHDLVRENCLRCRAPSHFTKLFVGQAIKEVDCAQSLIRLLYATHPEVTLHRVEGHCDHCGRGKGCASLYVDRANVEALRGKLDHNVFLDVDGATGELIAHYVYTEQRGWLNALVEERVRGVSAGETGRPSFLPWDPMVVEESKEHRGRGQPAPPAAAAAGTRGAHQRQHHLQERHQAGQPTYRTATNTAATAADAFHPPPTPASLTFAL